MIIIIDFDGTIFENHWPNVGPMIPEAGKYIRKIKEDGHIILIDTCRCGRWEGMAVDALETALIPFDYVNCNHPMVLQHFGADSRKLSGDVRIDDTILGGIPDTWKERYEMLTRHPKYAQKGICTYD